MLLCSILVISKDQSDIREGCSARDCTIPQVVPFVNPCDCNGQVEAWLNTLLQSMQETIRSILQSPGRGEERAGIKLSFWLRDPLYRESMDFLQPMHSFLQLPVKLNPRQEALYLKKKKHLLFILAIRQNEEEVLAWLVLEKQVQVGILCLGQEASGILMTAIYLQHNSFLL